MEQIVDPVSRGGLHGSTSHSPAGDEERTDELGKGVFRTFPQIKKSAKLGSHSGSELLPESSPSTPAVPIQLRTPAQWARLRELISASSQARRRKRKKRRKKRLSKSSARHLLPSGIRTRKSGHYSTSPSFWQSPLLCPGVAWFNSGYSSCVSSQRLWISFSFSTCWTQILRSFLNLDILLLTPGIWQPLVRCLPCPGYTEKLDFLREDFSHYFLRAPCIWQSLYCVWCCIWSIGLWIFREMTPGMVSVLNTPRFDSGHIFGVSLRSLLEDFPSYFNAMLGSTVDTSSCVRLRRLVFLVTMHLALYSFVVLRP